MLRVSVSGTTSFQRCQQQYYYRYFQGLRRKDKQVAPQLGIVIHDYLNNYYSGLQQGVVALQAHWNGLQAIIAWRAPLRSMAESARMDGREDDAKAILDVCPRAERICENYFAARGLADANRYEILEVEMKLETPLAEGIISDGRLDMLTRDRETGLVHLWEHKSTGGDPPGMVRLMDLQTFVYRYCVDMQIDAVMWNYIRTKEPQVPDMVYKGTKREALTRRQDLDTTWPVYAGAIAANNLDPMDYLDVRERLTPRLHGTFFPRYEHINVVQGIMEHYTAQAVEIQRVRGLWANGDAFPIRSLSNQCSWCEFYKLCMTALTGGDEEDVIDMMFTRRGEHANRPS